MKYSVLGDTIWILDFKKFGATALDNFSVVKFCKQLIY